MFEEWFNEEEIEHLSLQGAVCPYCGWISRPEEDPETLYNTDLDTYTCENCDKEFDVLVEYSFDWTTRKIEDSINDED